MPAWVRRVINPILPVDRFTRRDRWIVFVVWSAGVVQGFAASQASATLPFTRVGLGLSEGEMSFLLGIARFGAFVAIPLGWIGDRSGRRRPLIWALALVLAGGSAAGLSVEAWHYGAAQAVLRGGTAAMSALAIVLLAETVSTPIRAYAISFYGAAGSLGAGIGLMVLPLAESGPDGWRIPHLLIGVGFLLLPFLLKQVPESRLYLDAPRPERQWQPLVSGTWSKRFWTITAAGFLISAYVSVALAFSTTRMIDDLGLGAGQTVVVSLLGGTLGGLGFFVGGRLADSWGRKKTVILSMGLALVGLVIYWTESLPLLVTAVMISSFGIFAYVPSAGSFRAELFPTGLRATSNTAANNLSTLGSALGLMAGLVTIDRIGLSETITVLAVGVVAAILLITRLPETRGQDLTATALG
jgi:MFS family permease